MAAKAGVPLRVSGSPRDRGRAQAANGDKKPVVQAITGRLDHRRDLVNRADASDFLSRQWDFAAQQCAEELAEMTGVADGFGLDPKDLFAFLHLGILADLERMDAEDGCSAWARSATEAGPVVGKNRDFLGEHAGLQSVFRHADPSWPHGREVLCIGSLGSPGAYSSGMNTDGLVVADTQIATVDHGIGWLRYFLMTRLLARHGSVADAVADIRGLTHAGGGSLVLADAGGAIAAVDLGHGGARIDRGDGAWIARTNHFAPGSVAGAAVAAPMNASSRGRLETLHAFLEGCATGIGDFRAVIASHDRGHHTGLCRHGQDGDSKTLSGAIFACRPQVLYFCPGNPCQTEWERFSLD